MAEKKQVLLEEKFDALEEMLQYLEAEDTSLEESFHAYEKGMKLLKECNEMIDTVEKKVLVLQGNGELNEFS